MNHSTTEAAIVGPTPSTIASASGEADAIASSEPNASASARAAVGPTCLIDSATSIRHSGRVFASSRLASSACATSLRPPALFTKNGLAAELLVGQVEQVALVGHQAVVEQRDDRLVAERLDVERAARGEVEQPLAQLRGAGHGVRAAPVDLALVPAQRRAALRALARETGTPARRRCAAPRPGRPPRG